MLSHSLSPSTGLSSVLVLTNHPRIRCCVLFLIVYHWIGVSLYLLPVIHSLKIPVTTASVLSLVFSDTMPIRSLSIFVFSGTIPIYSTSILVFSGMTPICSSSILVFSETTPIWSQSIRVFKDDFLLLFKYPSVFRVDAHLILMYPCFQGQFPPAHQIS